MFRPFSKFLVCLVAGFALLGAFGIFDATPVLAQVEEGLDAVGEQSGLSDGDPKVIIANIINAFLGILGILAILIVLYGGFTWMTSAGSEEKVDRAKKILVRGLIGVAIILLSYAIASFIIGAIIGATNGGNGGNGSSSGGASFNGGSPTSSFRVTDFSPEGAVPIRNVQYRVTVSRAVDGTTVDGNAIITNTSTGEAVPGTWSTSNNRMTFIPTAPCPSPNEDRSCFEADTTFSVSVDKDIKSTSGSSLVCSGTSCLSEFTTGSLVDSEDPEVELTNPENGDGVPAVSVQAVQAHATDDSQISGGDFALDSVVFDAVGATGDNLADVTIETLWDTAELVAGESYLVTAIVTDIAGNTSEDSITVHARPATCFNGVQDTDLGETGLDCGGDASSADYCGACDGSVCAEDAECSSGSCVDGVCLALPEIVSISPASGAPGTYVTITGSGFGSNEGSISFVNTDGTTTVAIIPSCAAGWSSTEIVVEVPDDAADGVITLTTSTGTVESTSDDNGALIEDFDVTDEVRPKLCALSPNTAGPADAVLLSGSDFGDTRDASTVLFGTVSAGSYTSWSDASLSVTSPSTADGYYDVVVTVNGLASNALTFALEDDSAAPPSIVEVSPSSGAIGQYVTLTGTNFGTQTGTVWFVSDDTGDSALAETEFPAMCGDDHWDNGEITIIVPSKFTNERDVIPGNYSVYMRTAEGDDSDHEEFTILAGDPAPGICLISPETGTAGDIVNIYGDYFGSGEGRVTFYEEIEGEWESWDDEAISVTVPSGVATGPLMVTSAAAQESNTLNFSVGESTEGASVEAGPATYGWFFSTGEILATPEVLVECSDDRISAVPNTRFTDAVCTNAVVYAEFSTPMDEVSLGQAVSVSVCTGGGEDPCRSTADVTGEITTTPTSFTFLPTSAWEVSTTYRVTVSTAATSVASASGDVTALAKDVSWDFTTKTTSEACVIDEVYVTPSSETIDTQYDTKEFRAYPVTGCVITDSSAYSWAWSADERYAGLVDSPDATCDGGTSSCATVIGNAEGIADVTAKEPVSGIAGDAELEINFTDPYVEQYQPDCTDACAEAMVSATFNTLMNESSVEAASSVQMYECENELCLNLTEADGYSIACTDDGDSGACEKVEIIHGGLTVGGFYRVVISGDVTSLSGVPLTRTNYSGDFSWTFRVRDDGVACAIERLSVSPDAAIALTTEDSASFTVSAFSTPDACSVEGQELATTQYGWDWTNPIEDDGPEMSIEVAEWWKAGDVDTDIEDIANGCTASCVAGGSEAWAAICGDSIVGLGEDCDDGGTVDGNGCSSSCLREGGDIVGTCGDGVLDRLADGTGEDCDDGGIRNGDGCSASCLNEGSTAVDAECGNDDLAYSAAKGGEECEDGNVANGDGCSNRCLNEGSVTLAEVGGAVCGNGRIDKPFENCDTAISAVGCSTSCLLEGSTGTAVCGDTLLGTGEECDMGDALDGDGCSSDCLLEGSSFSFSEPSVCGDGITGLGEWDACESDGGDDYVDSVQLAFIGDNAAKEVDSATRSAIATIEVTEPVSNLRTSATYTLMCTATVDTDCPDASLYGVGENSCCMARPTVNLQPDGENECRNASIYGVFTSEMDLDTFMVAKSGTEQPRMYAVLDLAASGLTSCPVDHTKLARAPRSWAVRTWFTLRGFVTGIPTYAAANDCVVDVTGFAQTVESATDGTYRVTMQYETALLANAVYTLTLDVDGDKTDAAQDGVLSANGVALLASTTEETTEVQKFTTGSDICTLDEVVVKDVDDSAYYFSQINEEHDFIATGRSYTTGIPEEITSLPTVYAWEWQAWADDTNGEVVAAVSAADTAAIHAVGENGDATVVATAKITADTLGGTVGEEISGAADITAYLCENPWPHISVFPWQDNAIGGANLNAFEGAGGWMNFSSYYCRDEIDAGTGDYGATVVLAEKRDLPGGTDILLKEYLLEVGTEGDAIGIRIVKNSDYLSPLQWFRAQGFSGDPAEATVDGFAAVSDGRTTYVAAPNQSGSSPATRLYANIYVISYNEGASAETIAVYEQLLANFSFATNVAAVGLCYDGVSATATFCDDDNDCAGTETCGDEKAKLRRDTLRLADLTDMAAIVATYNDDSGAIPALASGTYVRGLAASAWTSWSDALGGALDASDLAVDPLNVYQDCGSDAYPGYDTETCVNQTKGQYICPADSHVYHYRAVGDASYELYADLEYTGATWVNPLDSDTADAVAITAGAANTMTAVDGFSPYAFCDGATVYGSETSCGDGVVGGAERCEIGDIGGEAALCDSDTTDTDTSYDGTRSQVCNSTCSGWVDAPDAACAVSSCGNGVIDGLETCDDGAYNGRYGFCGSSCKYDDAFFCGDGKISASEACDCGAPSMSDADYAIIESSARPYGGTPGMCAGRNGTYDENNALTCAWNCAAPAAHCGDAVIDSGEQCDGDADVYDGALCCGGSENDGEQCSDNSDCWGKGSTKGYCGRAAARAAGESVFGAVMASCTVATDACEPTVDGYATTRTMNCEDDGSAGQSCQWEATAWENIACKQVGTCGDGTIDSGEACDDGNTDGTDSCTSACTVNVCGDGFLYVDEEQCDEGSNNGARCDANYGSSCTACSTTCRYEAASGEFCGDGVINGGEYCDAYDVPYMWYDTRYATAGYLDGDGIIGECDSNNAGDSYSDVYGEPGYEYLNTDNVTSYSDPICRKVGICNGGPDNGEHCYERSSMFGGGIGDTCSDGGSCVFPSCAGSCMSTCPLTYDNASVLITSNQVGARASSSVDLYSYNASSTSTLPNAATITVPSCEAVSSITADMQYVGDPMQTYVVFITDLSPSMGNTVGSSVLSRYEIATQSLETAIDTLYDELDENVHIGLVAYKNEQKNECYASETACDSDDDCGSGDTCNAATTHYRSLPFTEEGNQSDLSTEIATYFANVDSDNGTPLLNGVTAAKEMLDGVYSIDEDPNTRYIAILLSDGNLPTGTDSPTDIINALKPKYELYTAAITSETTDIDIMSGWSSGNPHTTSGIDYAYDAQTEDELTQMYADIIDSIVGVTVQILSDSGTSTPYTDTLTVRQGTDVEMPWPQGFTCDTSSEQELPIRLTFSGTGKMEFSNVRVNYCAP